MSNTLLLLAGAVFFDALTTAILSRRVRRNTELLLREISAHGSSYEISSDGTAILCRRCFMVSHHPEDIRQLYCGHCHQFHDSWLMGRKA